MPGNRCRSTCCACMKAPLRKQYAASVCNSVQSTAVGINGKAVSSTYLYPQELQKLMCTLPPSLS